MNPGRPAVGEGVDASSEMTSPSMPMPLEYATPIDVPQHSRALTFTASAMLGSVTFGAAWIAFWNLTFEPIVGVIAAVVAALGVVGLVRLTRRKPRRTAAIVGAISGILALVAIASVMLF